jgi:hypothetical protein
VSFAVTNRQVGWAALVALAGFFIGGEAGGAPGIIVGAAWGGAIGYGIGSIFEQKQATKWVVIYWVATLGLFGPLPALVIAAVPRPHISDASLTLAGAVGAIAGALVGLLAGTLHLWRLRRKV